MDEVKHVLIERDILTATKTPWLVSLLYAFQDRDHVYLAMVSLTRLMDVCRAVRLMRCICEVRNTFREVTLGPC